MYVEKFNSGVFPTKSGLTALVNFYLTGIVLYDIPYTNENKILGDSHKIKYHQFTSYASETIDKEIREFLENN